MSGGTFAITLAKEDFKFSCGHFTVFGPDRAELLHGHNYQVRLELVGTALDDNDLLFEFPRIKPLIRRLCSRLDSRTLVPTASPHLSVVDADGSVEVTFRGRRYRLPSEDAVLLPLANTSIEALARMLWRQLAGELELPRVETLGVGVFETPGQGCWYRAPLPPPQ